MRLKNLKVVIWVPEMREAQEIGKMFDGSNFEPIFCTSSAKYDEAIAKYGIGIGLFIFDSDLPNVDILKLCISLRKNEYLDTYIMIIGDGHKVAEMDALDYGADIFVYKPIRAQILSKRLNTLLEKKLR